MFDAPSLTIYEWKQAMGTAVHLNGDDLHYSPLVGENSTLSLLLPKFHLLLLYIWLASTGFVSYIPDAMMQLLMVPIQIDGSTVIINIFFSVFKKWFIN